MRISYVVHSASREDVAHDAMIGSRQVRATVPALVVEMVTNGSGHTFRFVPADDADMEAHVALFQVGAEIEASFAAPQGDAA